MPLTPTTSRSVLIPAGPRRRSRAAILATVSAVIALAGCGGSGAQFTRESVQESMSSAIRENVAKQGGTMDQLECVQDGDQYHWRCLTYVRIKGQAYTLTVGITCDGDTGQCISEPGSLAPKP